jgi:FkbM family methyltransferase
MEKFNWKQSMKLEERLKDLLIPGKLYIRYLAQKELKKGEREIGLLPFLVDRRKTSLDIGAGRGVYSYFLSKLCPKVMAFEPNPKILRTLYKTVNSNVSVEPVALSNESGTAQLRVPKTAGGFSNQGASLSEVKVAENFGVVSVETKKLDDYVLDGVGFIKIDVEGHESAVLDGARETLSRNRPIMLIEIEESHTKRPIKDAVAAVEKYGYRAMALSGNGLISMERFDPQLYHLGKESPEGYIFNFLFLPL